MDTIKDLLSELKSRLSNPFVISLIISWICWNWRIVVSILFFKRETVDVTDLLFFLEHLSSLTSEYKGIVLPLASAIGFTLFFPVIKGGIKLFNAWIDSIFDKQFFKLSDTITVPVSKVLEDSKSLRSLEVSLSDLYRKKSEHLESISALSKELTDQEEQNELNVLRIRADFEEEMRNSENLLQEARTTLSNTEQDLDSKRNDFNALTKETENERKIIAQHNRVNTVTVLDGTWSYKYPINENDTGAHYPGRITFRNGAFSQFDEDNAAEDNRSGVIIDLIADPLNKKIFFSLKTNDNTEPGFLHFFSLKYNEGLSRLQGLKDDKLFVMVKYKD